MHLYLNKLVLKQNEKLALKIRKCMIDVFNDAKRGTLSAWSWPSREVVQIKKSQLNLLELPKTIKIHSTIISFFHGCSKRNFVIQSVLYFSL